MEIQAYLLISLVVLTSGLVTTHAFWPLHPNQDEPFCPTNGSSELPHYCNFTGTLTRSSFPPDFVFGAAGSAYQFEGAAFSYGKGPNNWDNFTHHYPEKIADQQNGDIAIDFYHRMEEDVCLMKEMGLDAFRFSISWARILPTGKLSGGVNKEGIEFYNKVIDTLIKKDIQPFVTIFHWDVPQALEEEYGGFLDSKIVNDFLDFVDVCFWKFGDRVKQWITLNEPWTFTSNGYATGMLAPGRCSSASCTGGNSGTEPYLVAHHLLLSHAAAVKLYREKYQPVQKGMIGITHVSSWLEPFSNSSEDKAAAVRALDFMLGWFMEPVTTGDYPHSMRVIVGSRLPSFTIEQSQMLVKSIDFLGLNYYSAMFAADEPNPPGPPNYITDFHANLTYERNGTPIGPPTALNWLYVVPEGFFKLIEYTSNKYNAPRIYITENGVAELNNGTQPLSESLVDNVRIEYHRCHLHYLQLAIEAGIDVRGYFVWSLFDNFEWADGYTVRFGLNYIDYKHELTRYPKCSALLYKQFLKKLPAQPKIADNVAKDNSAPSI